MKKQSQTQFYGYWFSILALCMTGIYLSAQPAWQPLGPIYNPGLGIGRLERIAFDPQYNGTSNKVMYVCSPSGGLWKSIDGGLNWSNSDCSTDKLPFIGIADIAINPKDSKQLYIVNGTRGKRKFVFPLGVYKSVNGGKTWLNASKGIVLDPTMMNGISRILIDPMNVNRLYVATSVGIYRTTNSGKKWHLVLEGDYHGLEFNSGNPKIIYAAGTRSNYSEDVVVLRSANSGRTWEVIAQDPSVFKSKGNMCINLAVSPSSPDIIYVLLASSDGTKTNDLYISIDAGKTWKSRPMPYPNDHSDKIAIGVSPVNPGEIYIGRLWDLYKSINIIDSAFNKRPQGQQWKKLNIDHSDIHDIAVTPVTNEVFVAHDGGLWNSTANKDASSGLNIATINAIGTSETKTGLVLCGHQDCGSNIYDASLPMEKQWRNILGGDGREGIIDYSNEKNLLSATVNLGSTSGYGPNQRSMDGGASFSSISLPSDPGMNALNNGPMVEDPLQSNVYYFGYTQLYKGTFVNPVSNELKWERLSQITKMVDWSVLTDIAVSPLDSKCIYMGFVAGRIFKTTTGGEGANCNSNCWTEISPFKKLNYFNFVKIALASSDQNHIWAAFLGKLMSREQREDSATFGINKIMYSTDGGQNWEPFAQGLPETPVTNIVYVNGSNDLLFIGTEVGIYFRDAGMHEWKAFDRNLPNVIIGELEINYHEKKMYAGTNGRGLWVIDISDKLNQK